MFYRRLTAAAAALVMVSWINVARAGADPKPAEKPSAAAAKKPTPWDNLDYGPFLSASIRADFPANNMTYKGVAVKLAKVTVNGQEQEASVCFDTQLMRMSAAWTGGFLRLDNVAFTGAHGPCPTVAGDVKFGTRNAPAWAQADGSFTDPRVSFYGEAFGGMPSEYLHYTGLYRNGDQVAFAYTVNGMEVLDHPGDKQMGDDVAFTRTLQMGPSLVSQSMIAAEVDNATAGKDLEKHTVWLEAGEMATATGLIRAPNGVIVETAPSDDGKGQEIRLKVPAHSGTIRFELVIWNGAKANLAHFSDALKGNIADLSIFSHAGPAHWPSEMRSEGKLAVEPTKDADKAAYVLDEITYPAIPSNWPRLRFGGFDFFEGGHSAALCTWNGDVYIVKGIDDSLAHLSWRRIAGGLFQTLGLKIIDGNIYVHGRDQITILHSLDPDRDLNRGAEADFYENFNNDVAITDHFHEFAFDLERDKAGNLYIIKGGGVNPGGRGFQRPITRNHGTLMRISKHGNKLEVVASGFRAPNGMCVSEDGQLVTGDNQGFLTPVDRLNWIKPDMFCGVPELSHKTPEPTVTDNPLCWFVYPSWDNSCGDPIFVNSDKWGQPRNELFYLSYGQSTLMHILHEEVDGQVQGGAVRFPWRFYSGCMRARFNPGDGQLYVCGFQGWQTNAKKPTAFERVRYTGKKNYQPTKLHVQDNGIEITFAEKLNKETVEDAGNWSVEAWNYRWMSDYGSKEYKISSPKEIGREALDIKSVKLSEDGKSIFLQIPDLDPVMQMLIRGNGILAADGATVPVEIANTINAVKGKRLVVEVGKVEAR